MRAPGIWLTAAATASHRGSHWRMKLSSAAALAAIGTARARRARSTAVHKTEALGKHIFSICIGDLLGMTERCKRPRERPAAEDRLHLLFKVPQGLETGQQGRTCPRV